MKKVDNMNCVDLQCVSEICGSSFISSLRGRIADSHEAIYNNNVGCHDFATQNLAMTGGDLSLRGSVSKANTTKQSTNQNIDCFGDESPRNDKMCERYARAGFGMMFAIIITILVATLGVLAIRFSTQTLNTTTNEYIAIQLDLYLNSTTELAILYVQRNGFVCEENATNCDLGEASLTNPNLNLANRRADATAPIEKYIKYGSNGEYVFKYKMTPLGNYDGYNPNFYPAQPDEYGTCDDPRCFKEETKNAFILDIAGSVTNPTTNQTLRVTKRQIIKP